MRHSGDSLPEVHAEVVPVALTFALAVEAHAWQRNCDVNVSVEAK